VNLLINDHFFTGLPYCKFKSNLIKTKIKKIRYTLNLLVNTHKVHSKCKFDTNKLFNFSELRIKNLIYICDD
jgi:hypothetical protein